MGTQLDLELRVPLGVRAKIGERVNCNALAKAVEFSDGSRTMGSKSKRIRRMGYSKMGKTIPSFSEAGNGGAANPTVCFAKPYEDSFVGSAIEMLSCVLGDGCCTAAREHWVRSLPPAWPDLRCPPRVEPARNRTPATEQPNRSVSLGAIFRPVSRFPLRTP